MEEQNKQEQKTEENLEETEENIEDESDALEEEESEDKIFPTTEERINAIFENSKCVICKKKIPYPIKIRPDGTKTKIYNPMKKYCSANCKEKGKDIWWHDKNVSVTIYRSSHKRLLETVEMLNKNVPPRVRKYALKDVVVKLIETADRIHELRMENQKLKNKLASSEK